MILMTKKIFLKIQLFQQKNSQNAANSLQSFVMKIELGQLALDS